MGVYNEPADIDALVDALPGAREVFALTKPHGRAEMDDLYRDYILEHYKRPRNFGELEPARPRGASSTTRCAATSWGCTSA